MAESLLQKELHKRVPFECPGQEVTLNLLRAADFLSGGFQSLFERHGISAQQYNVLRILRGHRETGLPSQKILAQMITQIPDITRLVDRLEANGFVQGKRTEQDRRLVIVYITAVSMKQLAQLDQPVLDLHRGQMQHMARAEQSELLDKLRRPAAEAGGSVWKKACSR